MYKPQSLPTKKQTSSTPYDASVPHLKNALESLQKLRNNPDNLQSKSPYDASVKRLNYGQCKCKGH